MESINSAKRNLIGTRLEMSKLCSFLGKNPWISSPNSAFDACAAPSVTVIVTLYNYSEYIQECLDSVCATIGDSLPGGFDILVIDDCSTDSSANVVEDYIQKVDTPICLVKKAFNTGLADARNCGLKLARAPFVFILDADNWIYPNCLDILYQAINTSGCAAVYGIINRFDTDTGKGAGLISFYEWDVRELLNSPYIDAMAMFKKDILLQVGGYSTELMLIAWSGWEDYDLWLNLAQSGYTAKLIPQILSAYRVHPNSMIHTTNYYTDILVQHFKKKFSKLIEQHQDLDVFSGVIQLIKPNADKPAIEQLKEAQDKIKWMETSKFWKLRQRVLQIKKWGRIT
jgi:glycosyltransferase involved in cell wall biosynthesis